MALKILYCKCHLGTPLTPGWGEARQRDLSSLMLTYRRPALQATQTQMPSLPARYSFNTWVRWGNWGKETWTWDLPTQLSKPLHHQHFLECQTYWHGPTHWKALEEHFLVVSIVSQFNQFGRAVFPPGGTSPPFKMQGGLAPFTLQSNILKLPLFSLNWNSLCKIIKII
jgi:hypothetical protein